MRLSHQPRAVTAPKGMISSPPTLSCNRPKRNMVDDLGCLSESHDSSIGCLERVAEFSSIVITKLNLPQPELG